MNNDERSEYIAGLRQLADVLEQHDELPLPVQGTLLPMSMCFLSGDDDRSAIAAGARALPCRLDKRVRDGSGCDSYFDLHGQLHGLRVQLTAYRDDVCERVVTGTEEVTRTVKDPEALAAVPEVEVTETVETVEWRCHSILAPQGEVAA